MVKPMVGGLLAEHLDSIRHEVFSQRAALREMRAALPSMAEFYAGKHVLVTGGSGFLGRLVVEILLRSCPDIGNIYLVLRAKRGVDPRDRLRTLVDVPLFDRVRAEVPGALDKLVVLPGDMCALRLGLSDEHQDLVKRQVAVVFHVAASVRFDDPFQKAVFTNLRSTREVVELARGMPQLKALVHVSTAYTNIDRDPVGEVVYPPALDWREVIRWAEKLKDCGGIDILGPKVLGFQPNTYTFTKALAEKLIDDVADELPVIITRPSIVTPTYEDPIPGWVDNLYGFSGFWAGGFKGLIQVVHGENVIFDSIPADCATKLIVLASWVRGIGQRLRVGEQGAQVVNVAVGSLAGISFRDMEWCVSAEGAGHIVPYPGVVRPPSFTVTPSRLLYSIMFIYHHTLFGAILDLLSKAAGKRPRVLDIYRKTIVATTATLPFKREFIFEVQNQRHLLAILHPSDERNFCVVDLTKTRDSVENFRGLVVGNVRGILKYTLKEEDNPEKNLKWIAKLKWIMAAYHSVMALLFCGIVYCLILARSYFQSSSKIYHQ